MTSHIPISIRNLSVWIWRGNGWVSQHNDECNYLAPEPTGRLNVSQNICCVQSPPCPGQWPSLHHTAHSPSIMCMYWNTFTYVDRPQLLHIVCIIISLLSSLTMLLCFFHFFLYSPYFDLFCGYSRVVLRFLFFIIIILAQREDWEVSVNFEYVYKV